LFYQKELDGLDFDQIAEMEGTTEEEIIKIYDAAIKKCRETILVKSNK
jgi:DNA-directed RNA polymerase specialized sigma24 family protein